ncbi:hypothetical protein JIG36_16965 [Actinoplanes sp. LDG1-06]|uniref:Uncharacterized protein n=1 Tax=Paractinoplanes ovalisporus TaxID=2810368 RepID=A0ABS2ABP5_9ACTN|nr:hypothetical protein [Actinoplanes ovalisporus]MBM2617247.1 hypothetical protein [Actinoplanes ovalisporus]
MVDLVIAVVAVIVLIGVAVVLVRGERPSPVRLVAALAVAVLAAGAFAVSLYRSQTGDDSEPAALPRVIGSAGPDASTGVVGSTAPAQQGLGTAVVKVEIPMSTASKYPQGAVWLDPPRAGTDPYTGDISLLCATPGKNDTVQNCTGSDQRIWSAEPLEGRATIGPASGDPFADPAACDESNGVKYQDGYLELAAGKAYCLHKDEGTVALRVPAFPAEKPLPARLLVEMAVLTG